jgi:hypothetical protein
VTLIVWWVANEGRSPGRVAFSGSVGPLTRWHRPRWRPPRYARAIAPYVLALIALCIA